MQTLFGDINLSFYDEAAKCCSLLKVAPTRQCFPEKVADRKEIVNVRFEQKRLSLDIQGRQELHTIHEQDNSSAFRDIKSTTNTKQKSEPSKL